MVYVVTIAETNMSDENPNKVKPAEEAKCCRDGSRFKAPPGEWLKPDNNNNPAPEPIKKEPQCPPMPRTDPSRLSGCECGTPTYYQEQQSARCPTAPTDGSGEKIVPPKCEGAQPPQPKCEAPPPPCKCEAPPPPCKCEAPPPPPKCEAPPPPPKCEAPPPPPQPKCEAPPPPPPKCEEPQPPPPPKCEPQPPPQPIRPESPPTDCSFKKGPAYQIETNPKPTQIQSAAERMAYMQQQALIDPSKVVPDRAIYNTAGPVYEIQTVIVTKPEDCGWRDEDIGCDSNSWVPNNTCQVKGLRMKKKIITTKL